MTRRTSRISHDEVRRMIKAVSASGLSVGRVDFNGDVVSVVIGDGTVPAFITDDSVENIQNMDDYKAWRDRSRARKD